MHDSFFEKRFCFQLVERALPCLATVTYLASEDAGEFEDWMSMLKPMCVPQMARAPKVGSRDTSVSSLPVINDYEFMKHSLHFSRPVV